MRRSERKKEGIEGREKNVERKRKGRGYSLHHSGRDLGTSSQ